MTEKLSIEIKKETVRLYKDLHEKSGEIVTLRKRMSDTKAMYEEVMKSCDQELITLQRHYIRIRNELKALTATLSFETTKDPGNRT